MLWRNPALRPPSSLPRDRSARAPFTPARAQPLVPLALGSRGLSLPARAEISRLLQKDPRDGSASFSAAPLGISANPAACPSSARILLPEQQDEQLSGAARFTRLDGRSMVPSSRHMALSARAPSATTSRWGFRARRPSEPGSRRRRRAPSPAARGGGGGEALEAAVAAAGARARRRARRRRAVGARPRSARDGAQGRASRTPSGSCAVRRRPRPRSRCGIAAAAVTRVIVGPRHLHRPYAAGRRRCGRGRAGGLRRLTSAPLPPPPSPTTTATTTVTTSRPSRRRRAPRSVVALPADRTLIEQTSAPSSTS